MIVAGPARRPIPSAVLSAALALLIAVLSAVAAGAEPSDGRIAPLLEGLGDHHHPISSQDPMAQRYFDQALVLTFNFNHAEAARSFREAARRDPECAICYWGEALVLGPNPNAVMEEEAVPDAWSALRKAQQLAQQASESERAYIEALATRYSAEVLEDRSHLDRAYADAMRELHRRYPDDRDAATLFAEALMVTTPWDYWEEDGEPKAVAEEMIRTLEAVLEAEPLHAGANHLYIHVVEAERPELAAEAADRLRDLVPGAGHLQHMPSHIYIRLGRYHDAVIANRIAIAADDSYVTQCHAQGLYPLAYMPHNRHFLWASATLEGASEVALQTAREMAERTDTEQMREAGYETLQHYWVTPLYALTRFGRWDEILDQPRPADDLLYPRGVWHYSRAMALVRTGRLDEAENELEQLERLADDPRLESITVWDINTTAALLAIARATVKGELAAARGEFDAAALELELAAAREDALNYDEPPPWHAPVRQSLAAVYLEAGRAESAEKAYRLDLEVFPENGWSLRGLETSLRAQGKTAEADEVAGRFAAAWKHADVELPGSRF